MNPFSVRTWLSQVFLRSGFFLLGAYWPAATVWVLIVGPRVGATPAPPAPVLAGLALVQAGAAGLGGVVGLLLLARLRRGGITFRYPAAVFVLAAVGYLLAMSIVP